MLLRIVALASGGGTSVEALGRRIQSGQLKGYELAGVICTKPHGKAGVYERAQRLKIPVDFAKEDEKQVRICIQREADLAIGLGYISRVGPHMLDRFGKLIWNIHPTLLPKHGGRGMYGLAPHRAVLAAGDTETGPTVHIMDSQYDSGLILAQRKVPVLPNDTPETLQQRVLPVEYELMAQTLERFRDNKLPNCLINPPTP